MEISGMRSDFFNQYYLCNCNRKVVFENLNPDFGVANIRIHRCIFFLKSFSCGDEFKSIRIETRVFTSLTLFNQIAIRVNIFGLLYTLALATIKMNFLKSPSIMKTTLIAVAALLIASGTSAQLSEGKIVYERKMNMHKSLPPEAEQMKAMIPEFQTSKMELAFKDQQSLYKPFKSEDDDMPSGEAVGGGGGGGMRMMRFGGAGSDAESFKDYENSTKTEIRELGPKKYLLDDSLKHYNWKLSADTMTILGHLCHKATTTIKGGVMGMAMQRFGFGGNRGGGNGGDSTSRATRVAPDQQAVAWYADDITSPSGPDDFGGLPGLIMLLNIDEGTLVFTPLNFDTKAGTVKAPSGAKKITREEYRTMMEQQFGGMRRGGPGGGQQIIIHRD